MIKPKVSKQEWQELVAAKVAAAQEVLMREVASIQSGEDWKRYLSFQSKLHAYSPNNVALVWCQHVKAFAEGRVSAPEPTYLAGFRTWQALGRSVDKGQHGYAVLAPVRRSQRTAIGSDGSIRRMAKDEQLHPGETESSHQEIRGFTVEHVFDVSQTHGDPLPEPARPKLLEGEAPEGLGQVVVDMIEARGWTVEIVPDDSYLQGANGQARFGDKRVLVRGDMDDAAKVKTLIHEAAHVLLHQDPPGTFLPRPRKEVEAESVAYVVAGAHGMSTDDYSFPYVAGWAGQKDAAKEVIASQARVARAAKAILERSPAEHTSGGRVPGVDAAVELARQARAVDRQVEQARPETVGVGAE